MTLKLRITETAENDLADIWAYIAENSPQNANIFVHKLEQKFRPLCNHPEMGPKRDSLAPNLRVHFYRDYAIYYSFNERELIIIRVLNGARDSKSLFKKQ